MPGKKTPIGLAAAPLAGLLTVHASFTGNVVAAPAPMEQPATAIVEFNATGVAPEMLDWWWDNIRTQARYSAWVPGAHLSFQLIEPPTAPNDLPYSVGTVQRTTEQVGGVDMVQQMTWVEPSLAADLVEKSHWLLASLTFEGSTGLSTTAEGWLLYEYDPNLALDGSQIKASMWLPDEVVISYPEYAAGLETHLQSELAGFAGFLPDLFQQEFIETELESRGEYVIVGDGFWGKKVIVDQHIKQLTPAMMNWWWDNINSTARYKRWHPTAHTSFEWEVPPARPNELAYSPGAVQKVTEYLGPYKSTLLITWLDPDTVEQPVEYEHYLYAQTDLAALRNILPQTMVHEYKMAADGSGMLMRSTFKVPRFFDWIMPGFTTQLGKHALQEMQSLQYFLPALFQKNYVERTGL